MINDVIAWSVRFQRTVLSLLVLLLMMGLYSWVAIPREAQPDIPIPMVYVGVSHEGISPEDAERLIIRPLENELRGMEGLKEMTATATEGYASVLLEFEVGVNIDSALDDVRAAVDQARNELPQESEEPIVQEINASDIFPMVLVNLSGDLPTRALLRLARDLRDKIESISEVLEVEISGDREEVVDIVIEPSVFDTYGIQQDQVFAATSRNNRLVAAGTIDTGVGRQPVKVPGLFETPTDILSLPVVADGDQVLVVQDIAQLHRTYKDPESIARVNGEQSVTLIVKKRAGANMVRAVAKIRALIDEERVAWPEGVDVTFSQDMSREIDLMLLDLQNNVLSAILLVMIVIIAALGVRSGLLVGLAIPGSFLAGVLLLYASGLTLNIIVLFALIMATGMLVDGAIVVTEFADRKMTEGLHRSKAYLMAAQRMGLPIIASTVTTLLAFLPLLFWPGMVGEFMKYLPLTLIYTLSASLVMALIFLPALGSLIGKPGPASAATMHGLAAAEHGNLLELRGFTGFYIRTLNRALKVPWLPVVAAFFALIASIMLYGALGRGVEFFPDVDPEFAMVDVRMRGDLSIREMDALVREVESAIDGVPGIRILNARTGLNFSGGGSGKLEDVHGTLQLEFVDWDQRPSGAEILDMIRQRTQHIPGIVIDVQKPAAGPPVGKPVAVELASRNLETLIDATQIVRRKMADMGGLVDVTDTRPVPGIEWQVLVDRAEAARHGADITLVGNAVQLATTGLILGSYRPEDVDDEVDIRLRYPLEYRNLDEIGKLRVNAGGTLVPISNFVTQRPAPKVSSISRIDSRRVFTVAANVEPGIFPAVKVAELRQWLAEEDPLPPNVDYLFRGEDEEQAAAMAFLGRAFVVALFLMAIVLLTQFNSFYNALLILTAVIFSTIGVFLGLLITHQPFGVIMNGIGVIALAGIVVNNNIVLIDTFEHHRRNGMDLMEAVMRTGAQRLRPVMLTTATTILGLLPMVFSLNIDFFNREITHGSPSTQWWTQLATSVAFGLAFSTFLTLIVTPSLLLLGGQVSQWVNRKFAKA